MNFLDRKPALALGVISGVTPRDGLHWRPYPRNLPCLAVLVGELDHRGSLGLTAGALHFSGQLPRPRGRSDGQEREGSARGAVRSRRSVWRNSISGFAKLPEEAAMLVFLYESEKVFDGCDFGAGLVAVPL